jgi:SAM-dependent methyltransferase
VNLEHQHKAIFTAEKAVLDRVFKRTRGNDLLQISHGQIIYSENARVLRTFFLDVQAAPSTHPKRFIQGTPDCLPIESESIDIVLLVHTLDDAQDPLSIVQEAYRVLRPNGQLIIIGFNRSSLWHWLHPVLRFPAQWTIGKIKRLLRAQDFDITQHDTFCFWPPNILLETLGLFCLPYAGAVAMLVATKNIPGLTPLMINHFGGMQTPCGIK